MLALFSFQKNKLNILKYDKYFRNHICGSFVKFEGRVRSKNHGKLVSYLYYEGYEALAITEFKKIRHEIQKEYSIKEIFCIHRVGVVKPGDVSILLCVSSVHRKESFLACEYAVSQIKYRLPIWKKEVYIDKSFNWINNHKIDEINLAKEKIFYYRQKKLDSIGVNGQLKLKKARILIIGIGGLGCPVLQYLAAAGIGNIGICDGDKIELSNLHRQTIFQFYDCGKLKAIVAASVIKKFNPFINICIYNKYINSQNAEKLVSEYDLIIDCTDNFSSKFLISDLSYLKKIPLIRASIYKFEGQLEFYRPNISPCLRCSLPKIPDQNSVNSCAEIGVLGTIPGILGNYQANEAIKYFLGLKTLNANQILLIDFIENKKIKLTIKKQDNCLLCGRNPSIVNIKKENYISIKSILKQEKLISLSS